MSGNDLGFGFRLEHTLLAAAVDRLSILVWRQTKDGAEGKNPPICLLGGKQQANRDFNIYEEPADFNRDRASLVQQILQVKEGGNGN